MLMKDKDLLEMKLKDISRMLECQFDKNLKKDVPVASAVLFGTSPTTGRRMRLSVSLSEDDGK